MSSKAWEDALTKKRQDRAKALYDKLNSIGWKSLDSRDRHVMQLLGWFCLEEDADPSELISEDLSEG